MFDAEREGDGSMTAVASAPRWDVEAVAVGEVPKLLRSLLRAHAHDSPDPRTVAGIVLSELPDGVLREVLDLVLVDWVRIQVRSLDRKIRQGTDVLDDSDVADPEVCGPAVPDDVSDVPGVSGEFGPKGERMVPLEQRSRPARYRLWRTEVLRTTLAVPSESGGGFMNKFLGDCTAADLRLVAKDRYDRSTSLAAEGDRWQKIVCYLEEHRLTWVRQIPNSVLQSYWPSTSRP